MKRLAITLTILFPLIAFSQQNSNLSTGDWYKIAVEETGVYKITYNDLENYGIDIGNINPQNLAIFGNPAGMLPESTEESYYTDIQPLAIQVIGEEDGVFNTEDYILFFGQEPDIWEYSNISNRYNHITNIYTTQTNYFLTVGTEAGKRIQIEHSTTLDATATPNYYDMLISNDTELVNPSKLGKVWLGENFSESTEITFNLQTANTMYNDSNYFKVVVAAKCSEVSQFDIKVNGEFLKTISVQSLPVHERYDSYRISNFDSLFSAGGENTEITFIYNKPNDSAQAWIDYFEMELKLDINLLDNQMQFRSSENIGINEITQFSLIAELPEEVKIWNVTDPVNVKTEELTLGAGYVSYRLPTDSLLEFHAFNGNSYYSVEFVEQIENQDLHGITPPDYIIVAHPLFLDAANQLADFHNNEDDLSTTVVDIYDIYNEFSSGAQDISAIRNFAKYLREKSETESKPNYLLLFGDASYDYLDRIENNTNFVPTFESLESINVVTSFASDRYYAVNKMDVGEEMQFAVGRIPVSTAEEAASIINKIQTYNSAAALGAYKNEMIFIADNGDNNLHLNQAEGLIEIVKTNSPEVNFNKCYLDFFELIQTNDGPRYPEVNAIITNKTNDGLFYANYTGHGYEESLANEQILTKDDLTNWTNSNDMPLWVMAACDVAHFDNPEFTSLAEAVFMEDDAGAIALIGIIRASYAHSNYAFNQGIIEKLTDDTSLNELRFGDLITHSTGGSANDLKWTFFGDPALKIHIPKYNVSTITLNDINIEDYIDTISPGIYLTFTGQITDKGDESLQSDFNGTVYLKIFAPQYLRPTLGSQNPIVEIEVQDSILVEATAVIILGEFEIQTQLPANYFEDYGNLKLSWYAENGEYDASGYNNQLVFGGEPDAIKENDEFLELITVYPTVFSDYLNVRIPQSRNETVIYQVYNTMGAKVFSHQSNLANGLEQIHIPGLSNGMYILNMNVESSSRNFKVFKH